MGVIFLVFFFNWEIMVSQYCVGFCHTLTRISHRYTHVLSLLNLPLNAHPSKVSQSTSLSSQHHKAISHWLSVLYMVMHVSMTLSEFIPPSPSPTVFESLFSMSASPLLPWKQVHQYHLSTVKFGEERLFSGRDETLGSKLLGKHVL